MDSFEKDQYSRELKWKPFFRELFVSSIPWVFYLMYGLSLGTPTVTIPQLRKEANSTAAISTEMASWLSAIIGYASMIWVVCLSIILHQFGRKKTMTLVAINALVAFIVLYCSNDATHVLIFQIMHGMTGASQTTISMMVLTEYSSPKYRGIFLTIKSATMFWGIWAANAIGTFLNFRNIGLFGIICASYSIISTFVVPESPYWFASKERYEECTKSYRWLKGVNENTEKELEILINTQKEHKSRRKSKKSFVDYVNVTVRNVSKPEVFKPLALSWLVMVMYYFSGKLVCTVYAIQIIKKITDSESTAYVAMLVLDGFTVLGMYLGCGMSKVLKRRTLLLSASAVGIIFLLTLSLYLYLIRLSMIPENNYVTVALLTGFSLAMCCGPMILSSTIFAELVPLRSRSFCFCIVSLLSKCCLGTLLKVSPHMFESFGFDGSFLFFGIASTIVYILVYIYLPETKEKSLIELSKLFVKKPDPVELVALTKSSI